MKTYLPRRESILLTAIEILDDTGIQGLTTKEIAARQNITEAALYRHYGSKQEILVAVLEKFSYFDRGIKNTIEDQNKGSVEGLRFYITSYVEYYQNYPAITCLLFAYDILRDEEQALSVIEEILDKRIEFLTGFFKKAQEKGEINLVFSPENLALAVWGTLKEMIHSWRRTKYGFPLKERVLEFISQLQKVIQSAAR